MYYLLSFLFIPLQLAIHKVQHYSELVHNTQGISSPNAPYIGNKNKLPLVQIHRKRGKVFVISLPVIELFIQLLRMLVMPSKSSSKMDALYHCYSKKVFAFMVLFTDIDIDFCLHSVTIYIPEGLPKLGNISQINCNILDLNLFYYLIILHVR